MKQTRFAQLEALLEHLLEDSFARLFTRHLRVDELAARLAWAMEDGARVEDAGLTAPNHYVIGLNSADFQALEDVNGDLAGSLAEAITKAAAHAQCRLSSPPNIQIRIDSMLPARNFTVTVGHVDAPRHSTKLFPPLDGENGAGYQQPRNPQLIVRGNHSIPLHKVVINIGRRRDNEIVIDAPKVSRLHAQLRLRFGRYVIYDLGSSGGTFVNDHRITECVLNSGDVIALAGITMLYVEDDMGSTGSTQAQMPHRSVTDTQPMPSENRIDSGAESDLDIDLQEA